MNLKHKFMQLVSVLILLAVPIIGIRVFSYQQMPMKRATNSLSQYINRNRINELTLRVYYINPLSLTIIPMCVEHLIDFNENRGIIINGDVLQESTEAIRDILSVVEKLPLTNDSSRIDARIYYVFEANNGDSIFDVSMWGTNHSMFINGIEVEESVELYHAMSVFLPDDVAAIFDDYLTKQYRRGN